MWREAVFHWIPEIYSQDVKVVSSSKDRLSELDKFKVLIISYDLCTKFEQDLSNVQFKICIAGTGI